MYVFSGECLKRVAVLIAVMIWRVTQSSAKLRNEVSLSCRKSRTALEADQALLDQVLGIATGEKVRARLQTDEARVAADQRVEGNLVAVTGPDDELEIRKLALLSLSRIRWG